MEYKYRATCHKKCYWKENLWQVGEIYEGNDPPNKHFSTDGRAPKGEPIDAGQDPMPNVEIKKRLKKHPFNFTVPRKWTRKQMWAKLKEMEIMESKDALTNEDEPEFVATCGFKSKSKAGLSSHERKCDICQEKMRPVKEELNEAA
jgi:hypothetical protein